MNDKDNWLLLYHGILSSDPFPENRNVAESAKDADTALQEYKNRWDDDESTQD